MDENKKMVTERMFALFRECRAFHDLVDMKYEENNGDEAVVLSFKHIYYDDGVPKEYIEKHLVNVTADSGCAMIQDVWRFMWDRAR